MGETLGSKIDRLTTVNLKMWNVQETLYEIRRMDFEQFKEKYYNDKGIKDLWETFQKACDLNVQRNDLIDEIDETIINIVIDGVNRKDLRGYIQKKHKTY